VGRGLSPLVLAALVALLAVPAATQAALPLHECGAPVRCGRLSVPLDRSGAVPGSVSLAIEDRPAIRRPRRGLTILLAGGPGQSGISAYLDSFNPEDRYATWSALTPHNDIVVFDQRGTGRSGLLRCRDLEVASPLDGGLEAEACSIVLGSRRAFYRTYDSVEDIEAIRAELGAPKVTLVGVSYGTYVAEQYASFHPERVQKLVLDSVVEPEGVDPLYGPSVAATRRVLAGICRSGCKRFTKDPVADAEKLVARIGAGPVRGPLVGSDGLTRQRSLTRPGLFFTFGSGDFDPLLRAAYPAAVVSALRGDLAPILRLQHRAVGTETTGSAREFSTALLAATLCEEEKFPWPRTAPPDERPGEALAAAQLIDSELLRPFDIATVVENDLLRLCRRWPTAPTPPPAPPGPLPDVPVLLLAGGQDTRTPVESAERVAARFPQARLFVSPRAGHSVAGSDLTGCAEGVQERFLRGRRLPARCPRGPQLFPPTPPVPTSLRQVKPVRGVSGLRGRALRAVELTLIDAAEQFLAGFLTDPASLLDSFVVRIPGLRGGNFSLSLLARTPTLHLHRLEFVPGVRISGVLRNFGERRQTATLRLSGPGTPDGRLRMRSGRIRGRLGGRRVHGRILIGLLEDAESARADAPRMASLRRLLEMLREGDRVGGPLAIR
jgi:pimeloyl-ACP methyl ester carboxylesterase